MKKYYDKTCPLVSVVTVNYNQLEVTLDFLRSLYAVTYPYVEVFVVDNNSSVDPKPIIEKEFPEVNVISSKKNIGFAGGNNVAIKDCNGKFIAFLNNDTLLTRDFFEPIVEFFLKNPSVGVVSPKIIYYNTDNCIQYAGAVSINAFTGRGRKIGNGEVDRGQYNHIKETDLGHGAAMVIPKSIIKDVGLMPSIYFLYYEEHDWFEMIKRKGYRIFYVGHSTIYHRESTSIGKNTPLKSYYMARNRIIFMRRNFSGFKFFISMLFLICFAIPKNVLSRLNDKENRDAYIRGIIWNIKNKVI